MRLLTFTWSQTIAAPDGYQDTPAWRDIALRLAWLEMHPNDGELTDDQPAEPNVLAQNQDARLARAALVSQVIRTMKADVWGEFEGFPRAEWEHEVGEHDTNLGYWDWVLHKVQSSR